MSRAAREWSRSLVALALVAMLLASTLSPAVAPALAADTDAPSGMVGVSTAHINDLRASGIESNISESDIEGSVYVSEHASTTSVSIVTAEQAQAVAKGASPSDIAHSAVCSSPASNKASGSGVPSSCDRSMALVISDDEHHDGRRVAIKADIVKEGLGYVPPEITVANNETGETWSSPATVRDGWLVADVEHFSSNSVTFSGEIEVSASATNPGDSWSYNVSDLDAVSNVNATVKGLWGTERETVGASNVADGGTVPLEVAGTRPAYNVDVTLEGNEELVTESASATAVGDGGTFSYNVDGDNTSSGVDVTFYGRETTNSRTVSGSGVTPGTAQSISIGGNIQPTGPASGEPGIDVTAHKVTQTGFTSKSATRRLMASGYSSVEIGIPNAPTKITSFKFYVNESMDAATADFYLDWGNPDMDEDQRIFVDSKYIDSAGWYTITPSSPIDASGHQDVHLEVYGSGKADISMDQSASEVLHSYDQTIDLESAPRVKAISEPGSVSVSASDGTSVSIGSMSDGQTVSEPIDLSQSASSLTINSDGGRFDYTLDITERTATEDPRFDLTSDGTVDASYTGVLRSGESHTVSVDNLATGSHTATVFTAAHSVDVSVSFDEHYGTVAPGVDLDSDGVDDVSTSQTLIRGETYTASASNLSVGTGSATVSTTNASADVRVSMTEVTETDDPYYTLNGQKFDHFGTVPKGDTVSLATNNSVVEKTNTLSVGTDASLSADAPTMQLGFVFNHTADSTKSIDYAAEELTVRYVMNNTYASDRTSESVVVPFENSVYSIRDVEKRTNGGSWSSVSSSNYQLNADNELVVELGSVSSGDTIEVRANGSRVRSHNMDITVKEPTIEGNELASQIRIDSIGSDAFLEVSAAGTTERAHYTLNESWTGADSYVTALSSGEQRLRIPNSNNGGTFRLERHDTKIVPESNEVRYRFEDTGNEPHIRLESGDTSGDEVRFIYYKTVSGESYVLDSLTNDVVRDSAEANSPVTLLDDDSLETLAIYEEEGSSSSTGGRSDTGGVPVVSGAKEATSGFPPVVILVGAVIITVAVFAVRQRIPGVGSGRILLGVTVVPTWVLALELVGVPVISLPVRVVSQGLGTVAPALALLFGGLIAW